MAREKRTVSEREVREINCVRVSKPLVGFGISSKRLVIKVEVGMSCPFLGLNYGVFYYPFRPR